jgi:hypothetical protein
MTFQVVHQQHPKPAQSPYRIVQRETACEAVWVNRFLDRECIRCLAETTLRSYAHDLLHFLRWWVSVHQTDTVTEKALTESTLLEYVRFQAGQSPRPAAATINRRVVVADRALKSEFPNAPGQFAPGFHQLYWKRSPMSRGAAAPGLKPPARQGTQTRDPTTVCGRSCAVLVQFSYLARSGYRRPDAAPRTTVERSVVSQPGRFAAGRITNPCTWQRQQNSLFAARSRDC